MIVEDIHPQFYQDYSFITNSNTPVSRQALAAMTANGLPISPPLGTTIANQEWIVLTVAGNSTAPITINDMTVLKDCRKPPAGGTFYFSPTAGSGPFIVAPIYFDLDKPVSIGQYAPDEGSSIPPGGNFFTKEVISLRYQEPQTLAIFVTSTEYCSFTFDLNLATVNGSAVENISDNGRPFTITSDGEQGLAEEGLPSNLGHLSFASYAIVYAGGSADPQHNGEFIRVNPVTYHGSGDPTTFPVPRESS